MTKILVAEDEADVYESIAFCLISLGDFEVVKAGDGAEAVALAQQERPDLILMDLFMPHMSGSEACALLKQIPETKDIPVVFISGRGQEPALEGGLEAGAEGYILKPFNPYTLAEEIREIYDRWRAGRGDLGAPGGEVDDVEILRDQVKQLRKQRADLLRRLSAFESQATGASQEQFPLAELSRLTDGIVHDMRSGLGVIRNTVGFLEEDLADSPHRADLVKIARSIDFCELVLRNLSALGGQDLFLPRRVDLEAIVREVLFILERKLVDVDVVIDADPDAPEIVADEGQMKQVFMNLIKNAGEAMADGGTLTVRIRPEGGELCVEVADTGCGISPGNQARLFQEFFTTKERGYGLGLHIVHTIVRRHGGTVAVESEVGVGTTFTLRLPIEPE